MRNKLHSPKNVNFSQMIAHCFIKCDSITPLFTSAFAKMYHSLLKMHSKLAAKFRNSIRFERQGATSRGQ